MSTLQQRWSQWLESHGAAVAAVILAAWILAGLVGHDPWKPDEAYSFGLVYHILNTGDLVVPTLAGEPFVEKPPVYYIVAAGLARLLAPPLALHDAARLASGLFLALVLGAVGGAARRAWGSGRHGWCAALLLAGCLGLPQGAHLLITDTALLAGFAVALYGLSLYPDRPGWGGAVAGTGLGLGFMAKGLIAPGLIGLTLVLLPAAGRAWRRRAYLGFLLAAGAAAVPWLAIWPAALYARSPQLFRTWCWDNNFGRYLGFSRLGQTADEPLYYFTMLPWFAWPAWLLAAWALWRGGRAVWRAPAVAAAALFFAVTLAVLSCSYEQREIYALPMLPPLALLAAGALDRWPAHVTRWCGAAILALFGLVALGLWCAWWGYLAGWPASLVAALQRAEPGYDPAWSWRWALPAAAGTLGFVALAAGFRSAGAYVVLAWTGGMTLALLLLMTLWLPLMDAGKSYRGMIASLRQALPPAYQCMASVKLGEPQRALLHYHAGILTLRREVYPGAECDLLLVQGNRKAKPRRPDWTWRQAWEGSRPGDDKEIFVLFKRRSPSEAAAPAPDPTPAGP